MASVQPIKLVKRYVLRNATLSCALLACLGACADKAGEASEAGAIAEQQLQTGNIPAARRSIAEAIAARDDNLELHLLRGRIELAAESRDGAYDAYSNALTLDPVNNEALQAVAQLGLTTGHLEESLQATERILALSPDQPDALLTRGIHALIRRRYDEAISYAGRILAAEPTHENASVLKARALFMEGNSEAALAALNAAQESEGGTATDALTKLEIFRELRRPQDMAAQFARLSQIDPGNQTLRLDEANVRYKLGARSAAHELVAGVLAAPEATAREIHTAIGLWEAYGAADMPASLVQAITLRGSPPSREAAAAFFMEQAMFRQASEIISSLSGDDAQSLKARLLTKRGDHAAALRLANAVLAQDKTQCDALIAHSQASLALGLASTALRSGQQAASECPDRVPAWQAAANAYKVLKRTSGVERVYSQAFDAHPQDLTVVKSYAEWLLGQNRGREAVAIARRLTRHAPALLSGWRYYGDLCERARSGCATEAADGLERAKTIYGIDLEPGAPAPNGLIGRLVRR